MPVRLLALDLDGTLVQPGERVADADVAAVKRARAAGITVTIATGRISTGAIGVARMLGLDTPLVCADGAVLCDPVTGSCLESTPMHAELVEGLTQTLGEHDAHSFWFTADEIHGEEGGHFVMDYIRTWSPSVSLHPKLPGSPAWSLRHSVAMAVGIGMRPSLDRTVAWIARKHPDRLSVAVFPMGQTGHWTLLARSADVDKARGLARLGQRIGVTAAETAVVGDWINDVPMFRWAGRSFAMGQSPPEVAKHATDHLRATHRTGGGVAEAVSRILGDD